MSTIVIISGSPNSSSRLNGLIHYTKEQLMNKGFKVDTITVNELPAEDLVFSKFDSPSIKEANAIVEHADAVIIASPVYKASYTGVLKSYIDLLPQKGFDNKLIMPLFIAGSMSHLLSIDYSLKPVLASMGARHYTKSVYAVDADVNRTQNESGSYQFEINSQLLERMQAVIDELTNELELRYKN